MKKEPFIVLAYIVIASIFLVFMYCLIVTQKEGSKRNTNKQEVLVSQCPQASSTEKIVIKEILISQEKDECEKLGGHLNLYYYDEGRGYRIYCNTEAKYLYNKYLK
jgi:hypothetical protein